MSLFCGTIDIRNVRAQSREELSAEVAVLKDGILSQNGSDRSSTISRSPLEPLEWKDEQAAD